MDELEDALVESLEATGGDELEDAHLLSLALERIVNSDPAALIPEKEVWDSLGITEEDLDASSKQAARTVVL